jgi:hypothetical protein
MVDNCSPTEIRPNDAYVMLAVHLLWQLWTDTLNEKYFWKGVVYLQSALKKSPSNYHFRFLLIKFFNQSGKLTLFVRTFKNFGTGAVWCTINSS